jgi:hypothetical protein
MKALLEWAMRVAMSLNVHDGAQVMRFKFLEQRSAQLWDFQHLTQHEQCEGGVVFLVHLGDNPEAFLGQLTVALDSVGWVALSPTSLPIVSHNEVRFVKLTG